MDDEARWASPSSMPFGIVVMGVSGCGKSTIGQHLADRLDCRFIEGDALHPEDNVRRMAAGIALDDEARAPWLESVGMTLGEAARPHGLAVASCSALKRRYRDRIRAAATCPVLFVLLTAGRDSLVRRMESRPGHFMPTSLLDDQLSTLEPPGVGEDWIEIASHQDVASIVETALRWIGDRSASLPPPLFTAMERLAAR